jgi:nitric oxide reductase subunit C
VAKKYVILILGTLFTLYSIIVYTIGTEAKSEVHFSKSENEGKQLFQKHNCISCHQLYGLGGYIGPELTTITRDSLRIPFSKAILKVGSRRMPDFNLSDYEINCIIHYLKYVDATAITYNKLK